MAAEKTEKTESRFATWAPLTGLGVCTTWIIYLAATQIRDGSAALQAPAQGFVDAVLLAPAKSLGVTSAYLLLLCLGSLAFLVWTRRRVDQLPRRAIGLPLLLLGLSALAALAGDEGRLWGGLFGEILRDSFLVFGKPMALLMALGVLGFGLVMARDWFFFDDLRRLIGGGRAAPAFALGMGDAGAVPRTKAPDRHARTALQLGVEPQDDLDRSLDLEPLAMAAGLTALEPVQAEDDALEVATTAPQAGDDAIPATPANAPAETALETVELDSESQPEFVAEEIDVLLTPGLANRNKRAEIVAESGADEALEDFLAEESQVQDDDDENLVVDELPELDWSKTVDERSDADLFADLDVNVLEATEVADSGKEPEMFAATEAPVREGPTIGWDQDEDVDWEDEDDEDDDVDVDYEDDDSDDDDDDDYDEDDSDDDDDDDYEDEDDDEDEVDEDFDDEEYDAERAPLVAAGSSEAAPAAASSFELSAGDIEELFTEDADEPLPAVVEEAAPLFPALEVDEDELFELETDDDVAIGADSLEDDPDFEVQSLLFPEEDERAGLDAVGSETTPPTESASGADKTTAPVGRTAPRDSVDEDWAPWGEDSTPVRPAALMAVQQGLPIDQEDEETEEDDFPELEAPEVVAAADEILETEQDVDLEDEGEFEVALKAELDDEDEAEPEAEFEDLDEVESELKAEFDDDETETEVAPASHRAEIEEAPESLVADDFEIEDDEAPEFATIELDEVDFTDEETDEGRLVPQAGPGPEFDGRFGDPLFDRAAELCLGRDTCRISFLQRNLDIDFARAAALIERMEAEGLVGPYSASGQHEILVSLDEWLARR